MLQNLKEFYENSLISINMANWNKLNLKLYGN